MKERKIAHLRRRPGELRTQAATAHGQRQRHRELDDSHSRQVIAKTEVGPPSELHQLERRYPL